MCLGLATGAQYYCMPKESAFSLTVKVSHTYVNQALVKLLYTAEYEII